MNNIEDKQVSSSAIWKFILPSLLGIALFMVPFPAGEDGFMISVSVMANWLEAFLGDAIPLITLILIFISVLGVVFQKWVKPRFMMNSTFYASLFDISIVWFIIRTIALVFVTMVYFQIGPAAVIDDYTGGLLLYDLLPILFTIFLFAGLFLPLLLNFGLLEFVGALLTKVMRPLFRLPGRSSVDALTSWLGDGTLGVILTNKQYEEGYYSKREAAIIGTTFSIVSITFSLVVLGYVELEHMFLQFYGTIFVAGFIAAIIMPRIPPLSLKSKTYANGQEAQLDETIPTGYNPFSWGVKMAKVRADKNASVGAFFKSGFKNVLDMWIGVVPVVMAIGTLGVIIAEFTPVFTWLGAPFVPLLQLMQVPEAAAAAETLVVGFADMLLPAIFAGDISSEMTRFIIASVSVTQLIYLSEVGGVLLGSKIPVKFRDLVFIFLLRTIITLPIITLIAHIIF
ncbi:YjiH family protein [Evansella cellulosilytica]|uniref:Nucleoside recognition domain protein n=1 Tax=Evansella cellulosilytica (strain ATCC 21833 / DSM 2522 / FERM P-1141 / JCM 9156 / N-4) TaxID=649639 RepID=E6TY65_EVAC2|nr:YjiH family protein [Evansella cellulosilytica]ADU32384.1 nucleoside recognition domain protein [Evansella cellulosilytica DSM 2522]